MTVDQLALPLQTIQRFEPAATRRSLLTLLHQDLDFHGQDSGYASHNFHAFPAKYPPQLPLKFIEGLTEPGDCVLDPMVGSGTTIVEAYLTGRRGLGFDIDPLAIMISKVKTTPVDPARASEIGRAVVQRASAALKHARSQLEEAIEGRWAPDTRKFVDYWFAPETQLELLALITEIDRVTDPDLKTFLQLAYSSTIITKSGGVSLAFDLAHTRPHRAKIAIGQDGTVLLGEEHLDDPSPRVKLLTKRLRSAIDEFQKRLDRNLAGLHSFALGDIPPLVQMGDAQNLPLGSASVDLIVTSPPYASNAIDYMRAHKFSLVWLDHAVDDLGQLRKEYIGGEAVSDVDFVPLPETPAAVVAELAKKDEKKARVLHRYYSEMTRVLREMHRVLRPDRAAIVVVGNSIMRGVDTRTDVCLADIGKTLGFDIPTIGVRNLDRNRRMLPAGMHVDQDSQIQQRMHQEFVLGFYKPNARD